MVLGYRCRRLLAKGHIYRRGVAVRYTYRKGVVRGHTCRRDVTKWYAYRRGVGLGYSLHARVVGWCTHQGCHWTFAKITENLRVSRRKWTQKETESSERERRNRRTDRAKNNWKNGKLASLIHTGEAWLKHLLTWMMGLYGIFTGEVWFWGIHVGLVLLRHTNRGRMVLGLTYRGAKAQTHVYRGHVTQGRTYRRAVILQPGASHTGEGSEAPWLVQVNAKGILHQTWAMPQLLMQWAEVWGIAVAWKYEWMHTEVEHR